ncbi:hypothetical protein SDC9_137411 [bioreactor metagenome]|uniref:Na(+)/H(+) antiporter subunit G n=1 Tax=bioreactor metagenome TaxID=1076179 RepID=A0A645DLG8_9ZZZZ
MKVLSYLFFIAGLVMVLIGVFGMHRMRTFYGRTMAASLIDGAGSLLFFIGAMLHLGARALTLKIVLLLIMSLIINPVVTHMMLQFAWKSGHKESVKGSGLRAEAAAEEAVP